MKGKLWLSGGRKVYSCSDLHTAMCRGVDDYGNKQKFVAKDAYQQAPSTGDGNKGSKMVRNGEEECLREVPTEFSMTDMA